MQLLLKLANITKYLNIFTVSNLDIGQLYIGVLYIVLPTELKLQTLKNLFVYLCFSLNLK